MNNRLATTLSVVGICLVSPRAPGAAPPHVLELRTQQVDGITYFHVQLDRPADLRLPSFDTSRPFSEQDRRSFASLPRLVPQDRATRAVYYRHRPTQPGLSFCGQVTGRPKARFLLLYPQAEADPAKAASLTDLVRLPGMAEASVELDFATAQVVPVPKVNANDQHINRNDLRSFWALHQGAHFSVLETQVIEFPFYSFAREATSRKYAVAAPGWVKRANTAPEQRLYEITTGADAIAETLQLHRMLQPETRSAAARTVALAQLRGTAVPEQPWDRLLAGKTPVVEALAGLAPDDNYYIHFKSINKLLEFGELLDQWGGSALQVYELKSRDYRLRERYERQLCLKSTLLGKVLGPLVVKGVAITGSDPYLREGSDIAAVFHVANRQLFVAAVDGFIQETRRQHAGRLKEGRDEYHGLTIESFVAPLREVSLYRAVSGDFVIYSNSPAGVRRILDAQRKEARCLADASDFRYMRTLFPLDDKAEDGLVYLSDAFLRQLTGPASRIKEKRRLEGLTSLYMLMNAALFCAWETGKLPADRASALAGAGLRPEEIAVPEGEAIRWDAEQRLAVSSAYNTIQFATPLIELPIDNVTPAEAQEYGRFRDDYSRLWRTYFDPIGLRLAFDDRRVRVETHILPLVGSESYRELRDLTGKGTFHFAPREQAVIDLRLSVEANASIAFHVDANAALRQIVELLIRWENEPRIDLRQAYDRLFWKLPVGVTLRGADLADDPEKLAGLLRSIGIVQDHTTSSRYNEVTIQHLPISGDKYRETAGVLDTVPAETPFATILAVLPRKEAPSALYVAGIADRTVCVSANLDLIKQLIDQAKPKARKAAEPGAEVNAALFIGPANAGAAASLFLEYEGHSLSLLNNQVWNAFYQSGVLAPNANDSTQSETARRLLGFLPVSPDGSRYLYDARIGEVVNQRHGSPRRPQLHTEVAQGSELGKLLDIRSLRAELRFQGNDLHTVVTIERRKPGNSEVMGAQGGR